MLQANHLYSTIPAVQAINRIHTTRETDHNTRMPRAECFHQRSDDEPGPMEV